jgi:IS5 family transposase
VGERCVDHRTPEETSTTMSQRSFASAEYAMKRKQTRREKFLAEMERIVPWARLIAVI